MDSGMDKRDVYELLEGNFKLEHHPASREIRLYISSEFTDSIHEKSCILHDVFPELHLHCKSLGIQLLTVDLYSALPSSLLPPSPSPTHSEPEATSEEECKDSKLLPQENGVIHRLEKVGVFRLAAEEIRRCQMLSAGPNFITLLAQKYGYKPLHARIHQEDFELLQAVIEEPLARNQLLQWYRLDTNAIPAEYVQQPWDTERTELSQWMSISDSLSKTVRKAARVALGKDVSKVQQFVMSAVEEEIVTGIFSLKRNPNQCCFWVKRVFTDLLDQKTSDPALGTYTDMAPGKRGAEFDQDSLKVLNHLKEARLPAKYVGLDSTNIFEFLLKWQKGKGLDPVENSAHEDYLGELRVKMVEMLKERVDLAAESLDCKTQDGLCQEVMFHSLLGRTKAKSFMERPQLTGKLFEYVGSCSAVPMVLYGERGCGKTHIMAAVAYKMREQFPRKKMILAVRFIGVTPHSFSIRSTLRTICQQICGVLEDTSVVIPGDFPSLCVLFKTLLGRATAERPIVILLDGVDQLSPEDGASGMSWLPLELPPHVKIILSTASEIQYRCYPVLHSLLSQHQENLLEVSSLSKDECTALLHHKLSLKKRTLTGDQAMAATMVLMRCPLPLYADLLLWEVQKWTSYLGSKPWEHAAPPATIRDMVEKRFLNMEQSFGEVFFSQLAGCISASKQGLTEMELLDILSCNKQVMEEVNKKWVSRTLQKKTEEDENQISSSPPPSPTSALSSLTSVPSLLWAQVYQQLRPLVQLTMGTGPCHVIQWAHTHFKELAVSRYLGSEGQTRSIYESLADYFSGKYAHSQGPSENKNPAFSQPLFLNEAKQLYNVRKLCELPFCLARSRRLKELQALLTNYHWLKGKIATSSCAEVVEEFSSVLPVVPLNRSKEDSSSLYELRLLRDALSLSIKTLNTDPSQLPAQLYGRLMPFIVGETQRPILAELVTAALRDSTLLLTPLQPLQYLPGGPLLVSMKGHRDAVSCVAVTSSSPPTEDPGRGEGLCIVTSSWDKTLKSWDLSTTGVLKTFDGHTDKVFSVALTLDGQHVFSGSADTTVRMWHVPSAECLHTMRGHSAAVNAVVTTTDGTTTLSGSSDGTVKVWNTDLTSSSCGEVIFTLRNHRSPVLSMTLYQDQFLASGAKNSIILVTDIISGEVLQSHRGEEGAVTALATVKVDNRKQYLLTGSERGGLTVRLVKSGELTCSLPSNSGHSTACPVTSIVASAAGKVYTSFRDRVVSVWKLQKGRLIHLHNLTDQDSVLGATLADHGSLLFTAARDSSLQIWDLVSAPLPQAKQHENETSSVSVSPCGTYGVSGGGNSKVKIYDLENATTLGEIDTKKTCGISQVLILHDSKHIIVGFRDGSMQLWNGEERKLERAFKGSSTVKINSVALSVNGELIMTGNENAEVAFWNVATGAEMKVFRNHLKAVVAVAFTKDRMVSASSDGLVCVRELHTAKIVTSSKTHTGGLSCLAVSADSAVFVSGSHDGSCHVVDMETGELEHVLVGHKGPVTCVKVLSNCIHCLTGSQDGRLRVWDTEKGDLVATLSVDLPLTSCDVSWRSDCVLYGTEGGWVSMALLATNQRALKLITKNDSLDIPHKNTAEEGNKLEEALKSTLKTELTYPVDAKVQVVSIEKFNASLTEPKE